MAEGERGCNKVEEPKANNQSTNNQPNICIQEREVGGERADERQPKSHILKFLFQAWENDENDNSDVQQEKEQLPGNELHARDQAVRLIPRKSRLQKPPDHLVDNNRLKCRRA